MGTIGPDGIIKQCPPLPEAARWCSFGKKQVQLAFNAHNDVVCDRICSSGYFECEIVEPFEDEVFPKFAGRTFLDVGANTGSFSLLPALLPGLTVEVSHTYT